jgi:pimeloyl-ACP methyl ester carboxylesterase
MLDFQTDLIFPVHAVPKAGPLPHGAERLSVQTGDGAALRGIYIPPDNSDGSRTLLLAFGGNGWNAQDVAEYVHELFPQNDVVAFHYRGYPPSTGSPSGEKLIADAPLVYDAAVARVKPSRVFAIGFSIGTAVAAQLSAVRKPNGLLLVTPFDSLKALAQSMFPWLPIGPFFNHQIDAAGPLARSRAPVAIIGAERDEIVPAERTEALRRVVPNLVYDRTISAAGHNDIYARSQFHGAMREALDRLKA